MPVRSSWHANLICASASLMARKSDSFCRHSSFQSTAGEIGQDFGWLVRPSFFGGWNDKLFPDLTLDLLGARQHRLTGDN